MKWCLRAACLAALSLFSLPSGGEVTQGNASILLDSDLLQIQATGKSIIQWDTFDIALKESVFFTQSHPQSPILNRVLHGEASQILGHLQSNCPVYLVNPKGVFIGNAAQIKTAGFFAATANLSDTEFLGDGALTFDSLDKGSIINLGQINAFSGDVLLIAWTIDNQGSIEAPDDVHWIGTDFD